MTMTSTDKKILYIQTGGTIDKIYPNRPGAYGFVISEPAVLEILPPPVRCQVSSVTVCQKDSQDISMDDRRRLLETINSSELSLVLITHGTDTIIDTAQYLSEEISTTDKCIILTGATQPWCMKATDSDFNVGVSVGYLLASENIAERSGVHVAMNGCIIPAGRIRRSNSGYFEDDKNKP